ncbi:RAB11-binding protein RELCH homolog isoform X2 [Hydractinia symbiolongicarpus]|nr:RAB11-binding protein RELCH homolog isoform X2 [Hydractinia symbiolongicarpus]
MINIDEFNEAKKVVKCSISNSVDDVDSYTRQISSTFLTTLLSMTQIVGESRLSKEVSKEENNTPVQVIAESLPNIVPNVLLNKREELIPLILCAVRFHDNARVRDELLHSLFNLIKRPDKEQRKIIIDGCVTFAKYVEPVRIEAEFLPQCWEQINHKFSERRLLVAETCGNMAPYIPVSLLSSLVFSMLSQMLQEDRSEEVRSAVVKNLGIILSFVTDASKYSQAFTLLELGLNDITDEVVANTKNILLPVVAVWASEINKLQPHLIPTLLIMCQRSLQSWYEASITNTEGDSNALLMAAEMKFNNYIDCLVKMVTIMFLHCLQTAPFYYDDYDASIQTPLGDMRLPAMKNPLLNIDTILDDKDRICFLVNQFDEAMKSSDQIWESVEWICNECLSKTCEMSVLTSGNSNLMAKFVCYMCTICRIFGKNFTFTKIVPYFEKLMRNTGAEFLNDVTPVCSPLLTLFLCGVLSSYQEEEEDKKLFSFIKQCLLTISTQGLTMKYLVLSVTMLCETPLYQSPLIQTLRELVVYPVAEVRSSIAQLFGVLVKCVNKDLIASQVASAIISLTNDRDISVRIAAVPALGNVIEVISDKNLLDKVSFQLQTLLDTPELQKNINLQIAIINTFTRIMPNTDHKFRDEFLIPRLKVTTEINESVEDVSDRMEVVESLIQVLSAALCCFLSKETIASFIIPTLHLLKDDVKNVSPETLDSVLLLLKDAESKCEDDKSSTGSGVSSTSSKLFGGISSRLDKFKKKKQ